MINTRDIIWLSGLIEGEGCFDIKRDRNLSKNQPRLSIEMSDKDVIEKVTGILNSPFYQRENSGEGTKTMYRTAITGNKAIQWMMTLYSLMGKRRKSRIRQVIDNWLDQGKFEIVQAISKSKSVSYEDAKSELESMIACQKVLRNI